MSKRKTPFPHQKKGVKYLIDRMSGFLFFKILMKKSRIKSIPGISINITISSEKFITLRLYNFINI